MKPEHAPVLLSLALSAGAAMGDRVDSPAYDPSATEGPLEAVCGTFQVSGTELTALPCNAADGTGGQMSYFPGRIDLLAAGLGVDCHARVEFSLRADESAVYVTATCGDETPVVNEQLSDWIEWDGSRLVWRSYGCPDGEDDASIDEPKMEISLGGYCNAFAHAMALNEHAGVREVQLVLDIEALIRIADVAQPPGSKFVPAYRCQFEIERDGNERETLSARLYVAETCEIAEDAQEEDPQIVPIRRVTDSKFGKTGYGVFKDLRRDEIP